MDQILPVRVRPRTEVTARTLLWKGGQPGSSRKGGVEVARPRYFGRSHDSAWHVRQGPHAPEALQGSLSPLSVGGRLSTGIMQGAWWGHLKQKG
jgi:hypothetical protein